MGMKVFAAQEKVKPDRIIRGLNLVVGKHMIGQMISIRGMICFANPVPTDVLYIIPKETFSITCCICDTYI
jgi:hypothetical protein